MVTVAAPAALVAVLAALAVVALAAPAAATAVAVPADLPVVMTAPLRRPRLPQPVKITPLHFNTQL
jgi:hypothetical protein